MKKRDFDNTAPFKYRRLKACGFVFLLVLTFALLPNLLPCGSAQAAAVYNADNALAYAKAHWNDGKGICAEFVSDCVRAGGLNIGVEKGTGPCFRAICKASGLSAQPLKLNSSGYATKADNGSILAAGDVVFQWCYTHEISPHIMLCGGYNSSGIATFYAHNGALNNKPYKLSVNTAYQHTVNCNMGAKVIHISALSSGSGGNTGNNGGGSAEITVKSTENHPYRLTVPSGVKVQGYKAVDCKEEYRYFSAKSSSYDLFIDVRYVMSDGSVRYKLTSGDGYTMYIMKKDGITEEKKCVQTGTVLYEAAHPHRGYVLCPYCSNPVYTGGTQKAADCEICYPPAEKLMISSVENHPYRLNVAAGTAVLCYDYVTDNGNAHYYSNSDVSYTAAADAIFVMSDGSVRYRVEDSSGNTVYILKQSGITDEKQCVGSSTVYYEDEHPHNGYKICKYCSEKVYTGKSKANDDCILCYPNGNSGGGSVNNGNINNDGQTIIVLYLNTVYYLINDNASYLLSAPYLDNASDRTMVPLRVISEALGADVDYNSSSKAVTVSLNGKTLRLTIGRTINANGANYGVPGLKNGTTFVPVRYISEQLGAAVYWDEYNKSVTVTK